MDMKKFMKGCASTALVLFVIGFVLATVASSIRGRTTIENVVESVTGGRVHMNLTPFTGRGWGIYLNDTDILGWVDDMEILEELDQIDEIIDEDIGFNSHYNILKGNVEKFSLGNNIRELELEVGACSFTTEPSQDNDFHLEARYAGKLQSYVEDGTLYIRSTASVKKWDELNGCQIILYVPDGTYFDDAEIEVGAGRLEFDSLYAGKVSLSVGAGRIRLDDLQTGELEVSVGLGQVDIQRAVMGKLDAEIGMGEFVAAGTLNGDADVECSMGNVSLTLEGSMRDFNYELSKAMGNVTLGSSSGSGFSSEKYMDNGADKTIDVDCAVGNVSVQFTR
jgi:hypothetical protein